MSATLTAIILTFNEEERLPYLLDSIRGLAEQTLIWDSFSTDKTAQIAKKENCIWFQEKWKGWVHARNTAADFVNTTHVLFLDADEVVDQTLFAAILNEKKNGFPHNAYLLNRLNYIGNTPIRKGAWYPDHKLRLYAKNTVVWKGGNVHEKADSGHNIPFLLSGTLHHYSYKNTAELRKKAKKYAALASENYRKKPVYILLFKMLFSPVIRFLRDGIVKKGFTEGKLGFAIALTSATEVFYKYKWAICPPPKKLSK